MNIERTPTGVNVRVGQHVPALVIVFEAEAAPYPFAACQPEDIDRIILGLSDEWREFLLAALQGDDQAD